MGVRLQRCQSQFLELVEAMKHIREERKDDIFCHFVEIAKVGYGMEIINLSQSARKKAAYVGIYHTSQTMNLMIRLYEAGMQEVQEISTQRFKVLFDDKLMMTSVDEAANIIMDWLLDGKYPS